MKLSEKIYKMAVNTSNANLMRYGLEAEELEKQVRDQKPKRFFRTFDNVFINYEHIVAISYFTKHDFWTCKIVVLKNEYFDDITVVKEDDERFLNWLESWGVDSPEEDN